MTMTNKYVGRKNLIIEQEEQIRQQRAKIQAQMLEKARPKRTKTTVKSVPIASQSSKFIMEMKKRIQGDKKSTEPPKGGRGSKIL